ncbi:MAG: hypothetical protein U9R43_12090 [Thermodesulfobacteriota bacterium]|nr:hypothetical protein [Thermodesulfobacteriota bacterium]
MDKATFVGLLVGFIFGIIASAFGTWFAHVLSERRRNTENLDNSISDLKKAFLPEIIYLKHNANIAGANCGNLRDFLNSAYLRHIEAITTFGNNVPIAKSIAVKKALEKYCHNDETGNLDFEQYTCCSTDFHKKHGISIKKLALERIENILRIAGE